MTRKQEHFSRNNCPVCGERAVIDCRRPEKGQCFYGTDQPVTFEVWQVKCFLNCRITGPEHVWTLDRWGDVAICSPRHHKTSEKAREAAMAEWNKMCKALQGVFHG